MCPPIPVLPVAVVCFLLCTPGARWLSRVDRGHEEEREGLYIDLKGQVNPKDAGCVFPDLVGGVCGGTEISCLGLFAGVGAAFFS